jgi:hypothetical protein
MKPSNKHLLSRAALAFLTLLGGMPSAALHAEGDILTPPGRPAKIGNDGVGGIEKTPGSGPVSKTGPGSNGTGTVMPSAPTILPNPWSDVGAGIGNNATSPLLSGKGTGEPGTLVTLSLTDAKPGSVAALFVGISMLNAPFKGGTMVPAPLLIVPGLPVGPLGSLDLPALLPASLPSGLALYTQMWMPDAAAPHGYASTNGLELLIP